VGLVDRRIGLLFAVFLALLALAAVRASYFGSVKAPGLRKVAALQQVSDLVVPAPRGTIRDRTGVDLAVSELATTLTATPYLVKQPGVAAAKLAPILGVDAGVLLRRLTQRGGFVYLARDVAPARAERARKLGLAGIDFTPETRRVYPRTWLASQVIGSAGASKGVGGAGLEYALDDELRGRDGQRRLVKDARGVPVSLRDKTVVRPGRDVTLTLDAKLQEQTESVLGQVGATFHPKGATAIVMDPHTGALLALANWPRVDANDIGGAPSFARQDRAVAATYEPGSTFKAFTVAAALEDRLVTPDERFDLPPQIHVADRVIGESHPRGPVTWTTSEILARSSNVGAIKIGQRLGKRRFAGWVQRFGFGRRTGVELPGEERGIVLPLARYSDSSIGNLPLGQGISVTPMQMVAGYAAIANGGILRAPHILAAVGSERTPLPPGHRVISQRTALAVRTMLEGVIGPDGTAPEAQIAGYQLAGKTGTANKADEVYGGYSKTKFVASFVGFAPALRPKLLVAVMVDEPQGEIYGGTVAAPAFQKITSFALNYLRIPPA